MNLVSLFRSERLRPEWTYAVNGIVWRVLFAERGRIVGECRDQERKTASFFCLDEQTGKPLWQDLSLEESWWVGLESVQNNVVLLHTYAKPDMPEHKGIRAFDLETGTFRWRNDDVVFWFGRDDYVLAYRDFFDKRVGYEIDLQTGELRSTYDTSLEEFHARRHQALEQEALPAVVLPEILDVDHGEPPILSIVKKEVKGKGVAGNIEFIKEQEFLLFNYHVRAPIASGQSQAFENRFCVYRFPDARRLFYDVVGRNLMACVPDTFFFKHPNVFFIKDQQALTALRLWKS